MANPTIIAPDMNVAAMSPMSTERKNCTLVITTSLTRLFLNWEVRIATGASRSIIRREGCDVESEGQAYA
jgi:hypothetical protein